MASIGKTTATSHSGWSSGDGRIYNNNVCRATSFDGSGTYYVYGFGFGSLPVGATVTGVAVYHHLTSDGYGIYFDIQLCNGTTNIGTKISTNGSAMYETCATASQTAQGGSSYLWGLTAAQMKTYVEGINFGVSITRTPDYDATQIEDGFYIIVYYTLPPSGYSHDVNEVPSDNISTVNEVPTDNINSVNEVVTA